MKPLAILLTLLCLPVIGDAVSWQDQIILKLKKGGAVVEEGNDRSILAHRAEEGFIPASTLKIATAALALHHWGRDHHFKTDFYLTPSGALGIKGYGDPSLISEEWHKIARTLAKGRSHYSGIVVDAGYFDPHIVIDGIATSARAYDAVGGAVIANFNTINIEKTKKGGLRSAELQTPLTPLIRSLASKARPGKRRINLGYDSEKGALYAGELLAEFLKAEGVGIQGPVKVGGFPPNSHLLYSNQSSQDLEEIIRDMLEFSTNFTANQLFLIAGAHRYGAPATMGKAKMAMKEFLGEMVGLKNMNVEEGSGLSRKNSMSPRQMITLLRYFEKYKDLMPVRDDVFLAKTGTLNGVNTYAGYFEDPSSKKEYRFVIFINSPVPFDYKYQLAREIYEKVTGQRIASTH